MMQITPEIHLALMRALRSSAKFVGTIPRAASADTHAKRGDSTGIEAPLVSGAVPKADAHD